MKGLSFIRTLLPAQAADRGVFFLVLAQFGMAFCFTVVMSIMPFYIIKVSTYSDHETMIWIGMIMGFGSFLSAAAAPYVGSLTAKFRPKALFQWPFFFNGIVFLLMGFTESLPMLMLLRVIQGFLGATSTVGIFMIMHLSHKDRLTANLSLYQNAMTAGALLGPPVGAFMASTMGYHSPFVFSFLLVGIALLLCHIYVVDVQKKEKDDPRKFAFNRGMLWGWVLSFIATTHLTFMPSILPHILQGFDLVGERAIESAGFIMMAYTATAIIGTHVINKLTPTAKLKAVIVASCVIASLFQILLFFSQGVVDFSVIRMLQTGVIAAVIPMVMADLASQMGGTEIGILNSARFAGNGFGPLLATSVVAYSGLFTLYSLIAGLTVVSVMAFLGADKKKAG
jgi:DHA1 family multidrug resistance protein-like MFS transporter